MNNTNIISRNAVEIGEPVVSVAKKMKPTSDTNFKPENDGHIVKESNLTSIDSLVFAATQMYHVESASSIHDNAQYGQ